MELTSDLAYRLKKMIQADIYAAVTGLNTPGGSETIEKPVGTVFVFALIRDKEASFRKVFSGTCEEVIHQTIEAKKQNIPNSCEHYFCVDPEHYTTMPLTIFKNWVSAYAFERDHVSSVFAKSFPGDPLPGQSPATVRRTM